MKKDLDNFFTPKSIAIIGASENPEKVGNTLLLKLWNYKGKIIPVNPQHPRVMGKQAYTSVLKYPEEIDLAIIAIPSTLVNSALEECGKKSIKNVIIISAGFSETGNNELENQLVETAKKYSIKILGPNCFGVTNPSEELDTTFANSKTKKGSIAFVAQSGALWSYLADINLPVSKYISLGNMASLEFTDFIKYLEEDKETKKIVLYIEKLKRGKEFIELCKKSKKEIVVIKAGKTEKGNEATISHTASLATDFKIYQSAFKQAKVKQVSSLSEAFGIKSDLPELIKEIKQIKEPKISIITNAGGAGALLTDLLGANKINVVNAPEDLIGTAIAKDYESAINRELKTKRSNVILVLLTPQTMSQPLETAKAIIKINRTKKIIACFLGEKSIIESKELLKKNKISIYTKCI